MENPIKMDDLEVPLFLETPIYVHSSGVSLLLKLNPNWRRPHTSSFRVHIPASYVSLPECSRVRNRCDVEIAILQSLSLE